MITERERIGKMIKLIREKQDLTQDDIAEKTGLLRNNISRIEQGKYSVGVDILAKIGDALGVQIDFVKK